jgi:hypothetical protein
VTLNLFEIQNHQSRAIHIIPTISAQKAVAKELISVPTEVEIGSIINLWKLACAVLV